MILMVRIFLEMALNKMLLFIVNVGDEMKISKGHTLAYLTPAKYDSFSETEENNNKRVVTNISFVTTSETNVEILPAIPANSKMIFPGDHIPLRKVVLQDIIISADTQTKLKYLLHKSEDIISSSSNDMGYTNQSRWTQKWIQTFQL